MVHGLAAPLIARQKLGWSLRGFYAETLLRPMLMVFPYVIVLLASLYAMKENLVLGFCLMTFAVFLLGSVYWRYVVPVSVKKSIHARCFSARVRVMLDR